MDEFTFDPLDGVRYDSTLRAVYDRLTAGDKLTSLHAVKSERTVCLAKYISILRNKYGIIIRDKWLKISKRKHVKLYWIEQLNGTEYGQSE